MEENLSSEIDIRRQKIEELKKLAKFLTKKSMIGLAQSVRREKSWASMLRLLAE